MMLLNGDVEKDASVTEAKRRRKPTLTLREGK
jgi:hypothetical protein